MTCMLQPIQRCRRLWDIQDQYQFTEDATQDLMLEVSFLALMKTAFYIWSTRFLAAINCTFYSVSAVGAITYKAPYLAPSQEQSQVIKETLRTSCTNNCSKVI